jgi:hypothetical protein
MVGIHPQAFVQKRYATTWLIQNNVKSFTDLDESPIVLSQILKADSYKHLILSIIPLGKQLQEHVRVGICISSRQILLQIGLPDFLGFFHNVLREYCELALFCEKVFFAVKCSLSVLTGS